MTLQAPPVRAVVDRVESSEAWLLAIDALLGKLALEGWDRMRAIRLTDLVARVCAGIDLPADLRDIPEILQKVVPLKTPDAALVIQVLADVRRLVEHLQASLHNGRRQLWLLGEITGMWESIALGAHLDVRHAAALDALNSRPADIILTSLDWLETQPPGARTELAARLSPCQAWLVRIECDVPFRLQLDWLRLGVTRFIDAAASPEQLSGLLTDLCDDGKAEPYRVMVVDDEESQLRYYQTLLDQHGMQAQCTADPLVALDYIEEFSPDVLIADIIMPACNGTDLVRLLRQKPGLMHLPVIYVTVSHERHDEICAHDSIAEGLIRKPIDVELLIAQIRAQARRHRQLRRLERQQATTVQHLRRIQAAADQHAIVSVADASGTIIHVNERFCASSGYTPDEIIGQTHRAFGSSYHPPSFFDDLWQTISGNRIWQGEVCDQTRSGHPIWYDTTIVPFANTDGVPQQYVAIRTDITQHKTANELASQAALAKDDFLAGLSHEVRTPLNAMLGFAQILAADEAMAAGHRQAVEEILQGGRHLLGLIDETLDLAKIESGRLTLSIETLTAGTLAAECVTLMTPLANRRNLRIHFQAPPPMAVRADRIRLKQCLINLLGNAIKYNREGGEIWLNITPDAGQVRFAVRDSGPGIPIQKHDELFQPFHRLQGDSDQVEGHGIGLALTRRLVEMMGGGIGMESRPGQGSTFWLLLPQPAPGASRPEDSRTQGQGTPPLQDFGKVMEQRADVLCIEDNPANQRLLQQVLTRRPQINATFLADPLEGIERIRRKKPDLLLLDLNLPQMDGYEVMALLRIDPVLARIPVIAVTANAMPSDLKRGAEAGFAAYITKPIDIPGFLAHIDRILAVQAKNP